ncbi:aminotransferase class III-fold pyridoxal phosphate-dependent enzyme [Litorilituus lipolyticus]|uniref:Aminotransferase class III-fold pyridoxal phosphate-dependent enzyme n=1 Tax=Litorilituus lipolyticus TaxID=2491017 RepID=A0A502L776_9GAMM|nr:aminotransferase class III-fold pyridoxal phosphate-dependent enzyme [Litorilituus lipolyticus]TPH16197.1 aminotransferase class III-fold pyridoxal phosphate-dependent enzyme [Litorilituus lipolyticus]
MSEQVAVTPSFAEGEILTFLSQHYHLSGAIKALPGYCDQNILLNANNEQYIVKVANSAESKTELIMQNAAMVHLSDKQLSVPQPIENNKRQTITEITDEQDNIFYLRVLSFLPGNFYADAAPATHNAELWQSLGQFMAQINQGLHDFNHAGAHRYLEWDLAQGYSVCIEKKSHLTNEQQALVESFLNDYQACTLPLLAKCPKAVIHNDANDYNLLIDDTEQPNHITGLIDFGDMVYSHIINDLAITCAYALMGQDNPIDSLKGIVASYHKHSSLSDIELEVLYSLIALRLCVSVCNSAQAIKANPDNEYLLVSAKPAWRLLSQLKDHNSFSVYCQLREACGLAVDPGQSKSGITQYRKKHLGKTLSLSYQQPLKIVRGQGAYLFDEHGKRYLDMVNNVCHVGHCHPKVVAAGQQQMAKLNTNTRYLHDNIVNYADKLLATMPDELSVCMLVNSGSEANELAFRLAKNYTQGTELLVVDGAYHGNTNACIEASPYKFDGPGGAGAAHYVHKVELPDPYRGAYQGNTPASAMSYADSVATTLSAIEKGNKKPSAFICESLQGVAGQIIMPDGYLQQVYKQVRSAGGVCIADEVQVGFGRVGTHMWAFETQQVVPDIVTLGKPIGNGHPMAAVITTQAIADAFVNGMEYFNTFGGNPVSCAIGNAVLEVIEQENLQQHALETGEYFMAQLREVQQEFDLIGDVRGLGLFIGVELVEDRVTKEPATDKTSELVEFFKKHQILLSTEGRYYNILKIKPPLAFSKENADQFIKVLRMGLQGLR